MKSWFTYSSHLADTGFRISPMGRCLGTVPCYKHLFVCVWHPENSLLVNICSARARWAGPCHLVPLFELKMWQILRDLSLGVNFVREYFAFRSFSLILKNFIAVVQSGKFLSFLYLVCCNRLVWALRLWLPAAAGAIVLATHSLIFGKHI